MHDFRVTMAWEIHLSLVAEGRQACRMQIVGCGSSVPSSLHEKGSRIVGREGMWVS